MKKIFKTTISNRNPILILDQHYINLRFKLDYSDNLFEKSSSSYKPSISTFLSLSTWISINDSFYFNLLKNKDKGLAKRKVTFE